MKSRPKSGLNQGPQLCQSRALPSLSQTAHINRRTDLHNKAM